MLKKATEKTKTLQKLEKSVVEILAVGDNQLKPFIHSFRHEPENITLGSLGTLLGVFEVEDRSKDSAYIVNFLASVVKKEYFSHPKRPSLESLEAALHKVNLALSELIKNDNTAWLNKLNGAVCVLEKNNLHFSVAGKSKTLLLRNQTLSDISEGLVDESDPHPLKTFTEVASGRLKTNDKVLMTTPELFEILSFDEIQKTAQRLPREKFAQFIRTALVNQLPLGGALIVDLWEVTEIIPSKREEKTTEPNVTTPIPNAFSQAAFQNKKRNSAPQPKPTPLTPTPKDVQDDQTEYTDNKTGHIYVQGETIEPQKNEVWTHFRLNLEDRLSQWAGTVRKASGKYRRAFALAVTRYSVQTASGIKRIRLAARSASRDFSDRALRALPQKKAQTLESGAETIPATPGRIQTLHRTFLQRREKQLSTSVNSHPLSASQPRAGKQSVTLKMSTPPLTLVVQESTGSEQERNGNIDQKISPKQAKVFAENTRNNQWTVYFSNALSASQSIGRGATDRVMSLTKKLRCLIARTYTLARVRWSRQNLRRKKQISISSAAVILILFVWWGYASSQKSDPEQSNEQSIAGAPASPLSQDTNVRIASNLSKVFVSTNKPVALLSVRQNTYLVTEKEIVSLESPEQPKTYTLPNDAGTVVQAAAMRDLNTLFLYTSNKTILSFTPSNGKFSTTVIALPGSVDRLSAYLTYLYILDAKSGNIYRYPRAEGGFGEGVAWLKQSTSLEPNDTLAVGESLYIAHKNSLRAFSKGKPDAFQLQSSATSFSFTQVVASQDLTHIYFLDTINKRIVQAHRSSGAILAQYTHEKMGEATDFTVDEQNKKTLFTTPSETFSFSIE